MEFAILKALLFVASLLDGVYLGVLAHELGHAIVALALTRQNVTVKEGAVKHLLKQRYDQCRAGDANAGKKPHHHGD